MTESDILNSLRAFDKMIYTDGKQYVEWSSVEKYLERNLPDIRIDELQNLQWSDNIPDSLKDTIYLDYIRNRIKELKNN